MFVQQTDQQVLHFFLVNDKAMFPGIFLLILTICELSQQQTLTVPNGPIIKIPQGLLQGTYQKSYKGKTFSAFEGIPYAKPPVEDLRFAAPQPAAGWKGTLQANNQYECLYFLPYPILYGARGTEDCLYMYVYVPRETIDPNELLDVVVHIHGGAFMIGSPKYLAGPDFLMDKDVVYVSFNYRLGILGFLSTEDNVVPGNNGLKDQNLALQWIKENIKYFGGNPSSITITGVSAGGASVHFHYLSPMSKGLFHKGISQSGTALLCWALTENPLSYAQKLAQNMSCPINSTEKMVDCLKKIKGEVLVNGLKSVFVFADGVPPTPFGPVVEKGAESPFLDEHPYRIYKKGKVYDVPWITSNAKDEGLFVVGMLSWFNKLKELDKNWEAIMLYSLEMHNTLNEKSQKDVLTKIRNFYFKDRNISESIDALSDLVSDRMFLVDTEKTLRLHSQSVKSPVYYYLFSYIIEMVRFPPGTPKGATHADDGRLAYKMIATPSKLPEPDEKMMELFTEFIANFAKNDTPIFNKIKWNPVVPGSSKIDYLNIGNASDVEMTSVEHLAPTDFWDKLPIMEFDKALMASSSNRFGIMKLIVFVLFLFNCVL